MPSDETQHTSSATKISTKPNCGALQSTFHLCKRASAHSVCWACCLVTRFLRASPKCTRAPRTVNDRLRESHRKATCTNNKTLLTMTDTVSSVWPAGGKGGVTRRVSPRGCTHRRAHRQATRHPEKVMILA